MRPRALGSGAWRDKVEGCGGRGPWVRGLGHRTVRVMGVLLVTMALGAPLVACGQSGGGGSTPGEASQPADETSGPAYSLPAEVVVDAMDGAAAVAGNGVSIDTSHAADGVVFATGLTDRRCKLQLRLGDQSYNYDLPRDGSPIAAPLNMGNGTYDVRVMGNTGGSSYVEVLAEPVAVELSNDRIPYLQPNVFCAYDGQSAAVAKAREIAAGAENQGDVVKAVYQWMTEHITYDDAKAAELANSTGYIPNPDETLATGKGICFDYASLSAAMLRSLGIPCRVVTGYVDPGDLYHAWNMVYIDGQWHGVEISVDPETWSRIDTTLGAAAGNATVGQGTGYTDRFTY